MKRLSESCSMGVTTSSCTQNIKVDQYPLALTDKERKLIQQSWTLSEKTGYENCGQRIFNKIFALKPEIEPVFSFREKEEAEKQQVEVGESRTKAFYKHVRAFMNMLELAVSKSEHLDELKSVCTELGRRHAHFGMKGFKKEYWKIFENAIVECALEWEGSSGNQKTLDSWAKLVKYIIFYMQLGYENEMAKAPEKDKNSTVVNNTT